MIDEEAKRRGMDGQIGVGAVKRLDRRDAAERIKNKNGWSSDESAETEMERLHAGETRRERELHASQLAGYEILGKMTFSF